MCKSLSTWGILETFSCPRNMWLLLSFFGTNYSPAAKMAGMKMHQIISKVSTMKWVGRVNFVAAQERETGLSFIWNGGIGVLIPSSIKPLKISKTIFYYYYCACRRLWNESSIPMLSCTHPQMFKESVPRDFWKKNFFMDQVLPWHWP